MSDGCIFLGLGSNLGDRRQNLADAIDLLMLPIVRSSSIYETEPVDLLEQPWFYNCVFEVDSDLAPKALLQRCQSVENALGRKRDVPKGPRIIDIDILLYRDLIVDEPNLVIPHPGIAQRRFVLEPLAEIAPKFLHPAIHQPISELLRVCPDTSEVRKL